MIAQPVCRRLYWSLFLTTAIMGFARSGARAGDFEVGGRRFTLPEGFSLELAAGAPLVERPITIDFDEQGRLYVAESSGTNDPVEKQLAERPHRILQLTDRDGDGVFDTRTVFADQMMFPEGTLWHQGSLYVSAPPHIWKLTDRDNDGSAESREIWFDGKTLTGCANDLHGPYLGRDGYIYWCKGAFAEQTYERPGQAPFVTRAAHIFRRRADGSGPIEPVMTGGMDNPVDVVFLPNGERIFTTTFLVHPGGGQRDGLIHAIPEAIYGKIHDPIFEPVHKWTHPSVMPPMVHLGPAAPAGLTLYESCVFGTEYENNLFACLFNLHKVTRHVLNESGSTYQATTDDFLTSPDVDFHPTDVLEDADGSLLVVDTGGWYKLCCPTSQLHKPEVLGGIYRVRGLDAPRVDDPRGGRIDWAGLDVDGLVKLLDDPRPVVVRRAIETIAARPAAATLSVLRRRGVDAGEGGTATQRLGIVWAASRIDDPGARALLGTAATDADPTVRIAARNALALLGPDALAQVGLSAAQEFGRAQDAGELARLALRDASEIARRGGAVLVGRGGGTPAVAAVLEALARDNDRPLDHALTYALIEINDPAATALGLAESHPRVRRAAMVALDQMGAADRLNPAQVAAWLNETDPWLRESAAWMIGRHPEWGQTLADLYRDALRAHAPRSGLVEQLANLAKSDAIRTLLAQTARDPALSTECRTRALEAMARADARDLPQDWAEAIVQALDEGALAPAAIAALRNRQAPDDAKPRLALALAALGADPNAPDTTRLSALAAIPGDPRTLDDALFDFVRRALDAEDSVAKRLAAADVLARASLQPEHLVSVAQVLAHSGPLEVTRLLPAFEKSGDPAVGRALLDALKASPGAAALRAEQLDPVLARYPESLRAEAAGWLKSLQVDSAEQAARIDELLQTLPPGDASRGHQVFASEKAACVTCHALGYVGGNVGPDLTKVGEIRTERDLLEAIVYPSLSFVRSYEPITIATRDGRVINGIVRRDGTDELVLAVNADQIEHVAREAIEEMRPGTVSVMPSGLDQQLTLQELADLVAFLKSAR